MDDFIKVVGLVGSAFSPVVRWIVMKKDSELPWTARILRWFAVVFCAGYGTLLLLEKARDVGLW